MISALQFESLRANSGKLVKFGLVGAIGFAVDVGVLFVAMRGFGADPFSGRVVSVAAAMLATWLLNRKFTFGVKTGASMKEGAGYASIKLAGQALNFAIYSALILFSPVFHSPFPALAVSSILVMTFNFLMLDRVLYGRPK